MRLNFIFKSLKMKLNLFAMKKVVLFIVAFISSAVVCTGQKQVGYTLLGVYTPYQMSMEKLNGKVEKVIETNYWAIPDGGSYIKGQKLSKKQLDSLGYTSDFEATFDKAGDLVSCAIMKENKKIASKWELMKENNVLVRANNTVNDTLKSYHKLRCDKNGNIIEYDNYRAMADTLTGRWVVVMNPKGDTLIFNVFNYKGEQTYKALFLFNDLKQCIGYQGYNKDGIYSGGNEIKFDKEGKISELVFYDKDKNPTSENTFINEYDSKGNWIKQICKDKKGFVVFGEREYKYF
jgi:hypothetical protein